MKKMVLNSSTLELIESTFPVVCKFCLEKDCINCPFREERLLLEEELLLEAEPTLEKYEQLERNN